MAQTPPASGDNTTELIRFPDTFEPAERYEEEVRAGRIVLEIDDAALQTGLSLYPNGSGRPFFPEDIHQMLVDFKTTFGIIGEAIKAALEEVERSQKPVIRRIIARAQLPTPGTDAYNEYPILDTYPRSETDPQDPMLLCDRKIINVHTGDLLAIHHPAQDGASGTNVRDQPIPVRHGRDDTPKPARNVAMEDDRIIAQMDGRLIIEPGFIAVEEELKLRDGLTPAMGDIDFVGKILILGDVEAGVTVHCAKDITVRGSIVGSDIHCEGNLTVTNGIIGSEETVTYVEGNLDAAFVENAVIKVWGDTIIRSNFATSTLWCSGQLLMQQRRGHFVSGWAAAKNGIKVSNVGIEVGTKARLAVGRDYLAEERLGEIHDEVEELQGKVHQLQELRRRAGPGTGTYKVLPQAKRLEVEAALEQLPQVAAELAETREYLEYLQLLVMPSYEVSVRVTNVVRADTIIEFPTGKYKVTEDFRDVAFEFNRQEGVIAMIASDAA